MSYGSLKIARVDIALFLLGALINTASYVSVAPVFMAAFFYTITWAILKSTPLGGRPEVRIFSRVFGVGFAMSSVAAVYANQLHDSAQLFSDAAGFFDMATTEAEGLSLPEIQKVHEGSLAILIWQRAYDFFYFFGFEKQRYIGVTINMTAVALSGVMGIKMVRTVFGEDHYRFKLLTLMVSSCGLLWLVSALHLRDSFVLLAVTTLSWMWLWFLRSPALGRRLIILAAACLAFASVFGYLRSEFAFVPTACMLAALTSLATSSTASRRQQISVLALSILGALVCVGLLSVYSEAILLALQSGGDSYSALASETNADGLGYKLVVSQPIPIKVFLGSAYLFLFPIPFWSGFQLESAYHLFKSLNVLFFYFLVPLLMVSIREVLRSKTLRASPVLFLLFCSIGFVCVVAVTSMESRHLSAFLMPILLLATLPNLQEKAVRGSYKQALISFLCVVVLLHLAWLGLKI